VPFGLTSNFILEQLMNLKMSFLATASVALFSLSANAEIIHESDFEAEPTVGFGMSV
jgi:hypothetical protein